MRAASAGPTRAPAATPSQRMCNEAIVSLRLGTGELREQREILSLRMIDAPSASLVRLDDGWVLAGSIAACVPAGCRRTLSRMSRLVPAGVTLVRDRVTGVLQSGARSRGARPWGKRLRPS